MDYIVFDMEWNQPVSKNSYPYVKIGNLLSNEIIQIGAYKLDDDFNIKDSFLRFVRPQFYKKINKNVLKITEIDKEKILDGEDFIEVFGEFEKWCGDDFCFFTWGIDDAAVMRQNVNFYSLSSDWIKKWYNLQLIFSKEVFGDTNQKSLAAAMQHYDIKKDDQRRMHDALNDAYYTALVFQKIDIKKGIAEYTYPSDYKLLICGLSEKKVGTYKSKELAFEDKRVSNVMCPLCGDELECVVPWFHNNTRYNYIGACKKHGEFVSRIRFEKNAYELLNVFKNVKKSDIETIQRIKQKSDELCQRKEMWSKSKKKSRKKKQFLKNLFKRKASRAQKI